MELLTGFWQATGVWIITGVILLVLFAVLRFKRGWIKITWLAVRDWIKEKTKNPKSIATSALIWIFVILSCVYLFLFGYEFSLHAWQKMLTTHRGLVPFIIVIVVSTMLIISTFRANITIEPKWETRLLILMPTVLALSFIGHFLFFGIVEEKMASTSEVQYIQETLPYKVAFLTNSNTAHYQNILPWEAVRVGIVENDLYKIGPNGRGQKADIRPEAKESYVYYTFGDGPPTPIRAKYKFLTNNGDSPLPLVVGLYPGTYEGSLKIDVRYCDKIGLTQNSAGCPR